MKTNFSIKSALLVLSMVVMSVSALQAAPTTGTPVNQASFTSLGVVSGEMIFKLKSDVRERNIS